MNATASLALAACHASKKLDDSRDLVAPGTYRNVVLTTTISVDGQTATSIVTADEMVVGADEEYTPTTSIPVLATLAIALRMAGVQRTNIKAVLIAAATEALAKGEKVSDALELQADLDDAMKMVVATMAALPKKSRKGKVALKKATASPFTLADTSDCDTEALANK